LILFGNGDQAKIGTITSEWGHFSEWKRLKEEDKGVVDMQTLLKGTLSKATFMDLFENFILFDDSGGETRKIAARNHQYLGVNRAIEKVKNRKALNGKLGAFWHTQGSGKSYSMVMFSRKIHRKLGGNFSFVILTDRLDLDEQLYKTYVGCGVVDEKEHNRAGSGDDLPAMMAANKPYVFSLIHKFNKEIEPGDAYTKQDDIIVIIEEAHRSQYGTFAINMRHAWPNASYIGFTGTPLFKNDEITKQVFGEHVSTYDFQRAVEDGATVPLYYDARGEKLGVAIKNVNERIAQKLEEIEIKGIDIEQRLERELSRDYHIITADKRLKQIAKDFVAHYSTNWELGKAMFVCIDKLTCVKMYDLIEKYWMEAED
jgi:type I restriction enzyme R subunit